MKIVIVAGTTGGHLYPGLAVARACSDDQILFVGSKKGQITQTEFPQTSILAQPFARRISLAALSLPLILFFGFLQSLRILLRFRPDVVFSCGGSVSLPVIIAAKILGIKIVLHEPNVFPGLANRIGAKIADRVTLGWEKSLQYFSDRKTIVTGIPVRKKIIEAHKVKLPKTTILVMGGSQGARSIDKTVLEMVSSLALRNDLQIVHLSGVNDYAAIKNYSSEFYRVMPYSENVEECFALADLVVSRAGASTLAEITVRGLPAILIPYPYATEKHQEYNAKMLEEAGAAIIIPNNKLSNASLSSIILKLLDNPEKLRMMGEKSRTLARPDAALKVKEVIHEVS